MKKIISIILMTVMIMALPVFTPAALAAGGTVTGDKVSCGAGDTVDLKLTVSNNPGVIGFVVSVDYDPGDVTLTASKDAGLLGSGTALFSKECSVRPYVMTWEDGLSRVDHKDNGTLVTLTFKVSANAAGKNIPVRITVKESYDTNLNDVAFSAVDGQIQVTGKTSPTSSPGSGVNVIRLAGDDRLATAIAISKQGWKTSDCVVLANGFSFADALAGTPLAAAVDAPILLTAGESLESSVNSEITRLKAKKAYLLGGKAVLSENLEKKLNGQGVTVMRLAGEDRFGTAIAIAKELSAKTDGKFTEIFFACASNFPDALAVSSVAALQGDPILYVPQKGKLNEATRTYTKSTGCKTATVLGGTAAVSDEGLNSIKAEGLSVSRVYGSDRYATALAIYKKYDKCFGKDTITVATGAKFPDALAGAVFAAKRKAPVILVGNSVSGDLKNYLGNRSLADIYVYGGQKAVSDTVIKNLY